MRKWRRKSLIFLIIALFFMVFVALFIYTSLGIRTVGYVLKKSVPELKIDNIEGTLYNFKMSGFDLTLDGVQVKLDNTRFSLSGLCLLRGALCVSEFEAHNIEVNVDTDALPKSEEEKPKREKPFVLKTPIPIELENTFLETINVRVNDMRFGLDTFRGSATWIHDGILIAPTRADGVRAIFSDKKKQDKTQPESEIPLQKRLTHLLSEPLIRHLPNVHIPIKIGITDLTGTNWLLHLGGDHRFNNVRIRGTIDDSKISVGQVETDIQSPYQNAHAKLQGDITLANRWPINAILTAQTISPGSETTQIIHHASGNLLGTLTTQTDVKGKNNLNLKGSVNFVEKYLPMEVLLTGSHLQWPIAGEGQYQLNNFELSMSGGIRKLSVSGQGNFQGVNLPDTQIKLKGESHDNGFNINPLELDFGGSGNMVMEGQMDWRDAIEWRVEATINRVKLAKQVLDTPLDLQGYVAVLGSIKGSQWYNQINDIKITGHLRKMPFAVSGKLGIQSGIKMDADHFKLNWGKNKITLNGNMNKQEPLNAQFDLPDLALFYSEMIGKAKGTLSISGSSSQPNLITDIKLRNFAFNQLGAEQLHIKGDTHYTDQVDGHIHVNGVSLFYDGTFEFEKVSLDLKGNENDHTLLVQMNGNPLGTRLNITGHLSKDRNDWQGQLTESNLDIAKKQWILNHPTKLSYNRALPKLFVQAHCWQNPDSKLCLIQDLVITDEGNLNVELQNLDMTVLDLFLGDETQVLGALSGKGQIQWKKDDTFPIVNASLYSDQAYIHQLIGAKKLTIPFDIFKLNLQLNKQYAKLDWRLSLKEYGDISGNVQMIDPKGAKELDGNISLKNLSLSIFTPVLQGDDYAKGLVNANLQFGGNVQKPQINGRLAISQTDIKASQLPADVQAVSLTLDFIGQSSRLAGEIRTQEGIIRLAGNANWQSLNKWEARLSAKGQGITLSRAPIQTMTIIPDIHIAANQSELTLGGIVQIPKARIKVESLSDNVINVSPDEVMLNNNLEEVKSKRLSMRINSNLFIVIGDDVEIDAFGLNANIKGKLLVKQNKQGLGLNGQILIPQGRFHAYGQDLVVKRGELIFSGPVDMPHLNIEAIRNPDSVENNVTAGIRVTGTADNPDVKLFSEPSMSDQETLSYILRGQGLENSDQNENDMMTAILIGLGTAQGGKYIGNVGELFGIKDLSLDTQGVGDNSQVVVSGYILPNLQLKYGVGIFDSLATFTLRYRLMPKLYLDVVSSLAQSVDLLYQFEI